jgi:hypothetical protein
MNLLDILAVALVLVAGTTFVLGELALSRAEDLQALYWLAVGIVSLRAAVQIGRPGKAA